MIFEQKKGSLSSPVTKAASSGRIRVTFPLENCRHLEITLIQDMIWPASNPLIYVVAPGLDFSHSLLLHTWQFRAAQFGTKRLQVGCKKRSLERISYNACMKWLCLSDCQFKEGSQSQVFICVLTNVKKAGFSVGTGMDDGW